MKKFLSILFLFLSVLVTASPIIDWTCNTETIVCEMEAQGGQTMPCCGGNMEQNSMSMSDMPCCTPAARVVINNIELKVQTPKVIQDTKAKTANIKSQWFNSNYLEDLTTVDLVSVTPLSVSPSGFKFKDIDPLSYICIYRI